jgi:hypothetical protein
MGRPPRRKFGNAERSTEKPMSTDTIDTPIHHDTASACVIDAARRVAHAAHETKLLKTMAADAAETGRYAVKRAITRGRRDLEDLRDAAAYRVKRAPLAAVGVAFAAGLLTAVVSAQCARALRRRAELKEW